MLGNTVGAINWAAGKGAGGDGVGAWCWTGRGGAPPKFARTRWTGRPTGLCTRGCFFFNDFASRENPDVEPVDTLGTGINIRVNKMATTTIVMIKHTVRPQDELPSPPRKLGLYVGDIFLYI